MIQTFYKRPNGGYLLVMVLVFSAVLMTILTSFVGFIVTQSRLIDQRGSLEQAGQIAEAGLNYYKWFLAHYPSDTTNGTGLPGPYIGVYSDPEGGPIGEYSLSVASTTYCGQISSLRVSATGYTYKAPNVRRVLTAKYSRPNVASYSFILNSSVWAGPDRVINGPYHSNGGVRMDGTNNSVVSSGQLNWSCSPTFGCTPTTTRNGVFTSTGNANTALFEYPSTPVDFGGLTVDLSLIKSRAVTGGGLFFGVSSSTNFGYSFRFNSNNTVTVSRVTGTAQYWAYSVENNWQQERNVITSTTSVGTFAIPPACPVIYVEDKVWLEGVVASKVTIAAASTTSAILNPSIILQGNITYASPTSSGLLAIAEQDVLIGLTVPDDLVLNGIFIAKDGRYGRNHYRDWGGYELPSTYDSFIIRNSETHNGTIVSSGRVGTQWTSGGVTISGFRNRFTSFDRNLMESPPPFIPTTSDVYEFNDWRDAN